MIVAYRHIKTKRYLACIYRCYDCEIADTTKVREDAKKWKIRNSQAQRGFDKFRRKHRDQLREFEAVVIGE